MADPLFAGAVIPGDIVDGAGTPEPPQVPASWAGTATEIYARVQEGTYTVLTFTIYHYNEAGTLQDSQSVAMGSAKFKSQAISWVIDFDTDYFVCEVTDVTSTVTPRFLTWQVRA